MEREEGENDGMGREEREESEERGESWLERATVCSASRGAGRRSRRRWRSRRCWGSGRSRGRC